MGADDNYWTSRQRLSRRRLLAGAGLAGAGLALAACGGGNSNNKRASSGTSVAPAGSTAAGAATAAGGEKPVAGGNFVLLQTRDAASLDPLASQVYTTPERIGLVYPRLLYIDLKTPTSDPADTKQVPSYITKGWEFSGDGQTLTFHLNQGVKYSKTAPVNGREFVAEDVKFSINRYMTDPSSAFKPRYADIDSIETPDHYTVVFKLKKPSAYIMYALAAEPSLITPPEVAQQSGDYKQVAIGPGPFLHEKTTQGEGSSFRKNPDFVDAAHIYYDRYEVKVVTDKSTQTSALRTNQADLSDNTTLGKADLDALTKGNSSIQSYAAPIITNTGVWFNMSNPKWKDLRARQAISKAIDRQQIITQLHQGDGVFIGPIPVGFGKWAYTDEQMRQVETYKFDPAAAKQLWAAAGSPATSIQLYEVPKAINPLWADVTELVAQHIKTNLGLDVQISSDEYSTFINKAYNNKFPDVCVGSMGLYDPMDYLLAQYYPAGPRNGPGLNDPKLNAMLDDMKGTLDEAARVKKALDIQKYINEQVLSMAHLPQQRSYAVFNAKLRNFYPAAIRTPGMEWTLQSWKAK